MSELYLKLLGPAELESITRAIDSAEYQDGVATAGPLAYGVKHNLELASREVSRKASEPILRALGQSGPFQAWALPHVVARFLFNRYDEGMGYGEHVDNAVFQGPDGQLHRSDLSITVFLSPPESYAGGELIVDADGESKAIKLPAGEAVVYPASTLHKVEPVRHGSRRAAVSWITSAVRDHERRRILFDLSLATDALMVKREHEKTALTLDKTRSNLLRMWAEI